MTEPTDAAAAAAGALQSAFDPAGFMRMMRRYGHGATVGIRYDAHGDDWVQLAFDWKPELVGDPATGVIASGPILTLMDTATSMAIWMKLDSFIPQATLDLRVDYLRPATPHRAVIGRGQCYRVTRSIAFVRGQAHDGDPADPIANVVGTFMFLEDQG